MKVSAIEAYTNPIYAGNASAKKLAKVRPERGAPIDAQSASLNSGDEVVSKKEREFFIKMFPENSAALERHVLFNRDGRLDEQSIVKGAIVDGFA